MREKGLRFLSFAFLGLLALCSCDDSSDTKGADKPKSFTEGVYSGDGIVATADGGAFLAPPGGGLYYLYKGEAIRVKEVPKLSDHDSTEGKPVASVWPQLQRERRGKLLAMKELEDLKNPDDPEPEGDQYIY